MKNNEKELIDAFKELEQSIMEKKKEVTKINELKQRIRDSKLNKILT